MNFNNNWTIEDDFKSIVASCNEIWPSLKDKTIYITGGTGFIGRWILESIYHANLDMNFNIKAIILTRNIKSFKNKSPHLAVYENFMFEEGDILNFSSNAKCDYIIHAATDASADLNENNPKLMFDTIVDGTKNILEFARKTGVEDILFLSSGAVYGQQPWEMTHISEEWNGSLDCVNPRNTYAEAKRAAELLCAIYTKQYGFDIKIARIFSTIGPLLPMDTHFAIGNFILDASSNKEIIIKGNGLPCRSFLYISDLIIWLFNIMLSSTKSKIFNVGSANSISIKDLAKVVSETLNGNGYTVLGENDKGWNLGRYVPDIKLIKDELKVEEKISLEESILRTAKWNNLKKKDLNG